jgi:hypothetical protein
MMPVRLIGKLMRNSIITPETGSFLAENIINKKACL